LSHSHSTYKSKQKNLLITIILNVIITLGQVVGGIISGSLALLSDALHNFSDVVSLVVSYIASFFSNKKASVNKTFGYKRAEIIAAFINACSLLVIAGFLIIEAIERFLLPEKIDANLVIWLSLLAIVGNGVSVLILHADAKSNLNIRSSYLHLFTDLLGSFAVLIGGLLMHFYEIYWVDAVLTLIIAIYLLIVGFQLAKKAFNVLMLFTPEDVELEELINAVIKIPEIKNMHHVHVWQLNDDEIHLEAHIDFVEDLPLSKFDLVLEQIEAIAKNKYGINHINIQPEYRKTDNKNIIVQD
jgi:cobalt-zinc-cadmium efflux system protein